MFTGKEEFMKVWRAKRLRFKIRLPVFQKNKECVLPTEGQKDGVNNWFSNMFEKVLFENQERKL